MKLERMPAATRAGVQGRLAPVGAPVEPCSRMVEHQQCSRRSPGPCDPPGYDAHNAFSAVVTVRNELLEAAKEGRLRLSEASARRRRQLTTRCLNDRRQRARQELEQSTSRLDQTSALNLEPPPALVNQPTAHPVEAVQQTAESAAASPAGVLLGDLCALPSRES